MRRTDIDIAERLLREAMGLTDIGAKKNLVNYALKAPDAELTAPTETQGTRI